MKRRRQIISITVAIAVLAGIGFWWSGRDANPVAQFLTAPVVSAEIINSVSTTGTIVDQYTYQVDTSGELLLKQIAGVATASAGVPVNPKDDWITAKISRAEGSQVAKGQTILSLRNFDGSLRNITAPRKGQVLSLNTFEGLSVTGTLATIGAGRILVSVSVTEGQLNNFIPNQPVAIAVNSSDQTTYGSVVFVSPTADSTSTSTATYRVLMQVAPGVFPEGIKPGMTATVEFPIDGDDNVRYTNARFLYEFEFSVNVDNEAALVSKNGVAVTSTPSVTSNADNWTVESLNVSVGSYLELGAPIAVLRNFDGSKKTITAKASGYVRDIYTAPNALVAGSIIELGVGPVLAAVEVSEFDIGQVTIGKTATFSTNDQTTDFSAKVILISAKAIVDTSAVAKFKVYLEPEGNSDSLRIGSSVRANIILESTNAQLAVPVQALKQEAGENVVEVLGPNGEAVIRKVTVGVIGDQLVEIISGIDLNEEIIIGNRAPQEVLPTQPTGPFGEGGNETDENETTD